MKIYFCGSIVGGRDDEDVYKRIVSQLKTYGTVLTEVVVDDDIIELEDKCDPKKIHDQDVQWLEEADAVVAEVTQPSHGVGYEVGRAVTMNKKMLLLFRPETGKRRSSMMVGAANGKNVIFMDYQEKDIPSILKDFLSGKKLSKENGI